MSVLRRHDETNPSNDETPNVSLWLATHHIMLSFQPNDRVVHCPTLVAVVGVALLLSATSVDSFWIAVPSNCFLVSTHQPLTRHSTLSSALRRQSSSSSTNSIEDWKAFGNELIEEACHKLGVDHFSIVWKPGKITLSMIQMHLSRHLIVRMDRMRMKWIHLKTQVVMPLENQAWT